MIAGEGLNIAGAIAVLAVGLIVFVEGIDRLGRSWSEIVNRWPSAAEDERADALVPGFAAERYGPSYEGRCRCNACRSFPKEPCSDFDGD